MDRRSERRLVTCLFIDIVGSTNLGQELGAERMRRVLGDAFTRLSAIATAEGGTVEKYIGDAVFVLFGAPTAYADDVLRALRAADAAVRWSTTTGTVTIRAGVETGEALVDLAAIGEHQRMAVGTCVNVAARLQQSAEIGEVLVGETALEAARGLARFGESRTISLKGVGAVRAAPLVASGEEAAAPAPFVGRTAELAKLRAAFERADSGRAALGILIGPPGIGKSRVADEFIRSLDPDVLVLETACRPGSETGISPLRGLIPSDDADVPDELAHSAGLRADPRLLALSTFDRRQQIEAAWREYFSRLTKARAVLVRIEDLHWAENEVVRLIDRLTFDSPLRLLVVATVRPEFPGQPLIRPNADRVLIEVPPLDPDSARALAFAAGPAQDLVDRAEGHPLFILELVRGRMSSADALPVTVQAAISARLDELTPSDRELLQTASVIGETFDARSVSLLSERDPADVAGALGRLVHLRYLRAIDGRFRFDHALVHDTAYGRLPVETRMRLHGQYARDGLPADAHEALAHHWWEALRPPDAEWVWADDADREAMRVEALAAHIAAGRALGDRLATERMVETFEHALQLTQSPLEKARVEEAVGLAYQRNAKGDEASTHRMRAIERYREAAAAPPVSLYADMLDLVAFNWGYFRDHEGFGNVLGLIDEAIAIARANRDPALLRVLIQRAAVTNDASVLPEIESLLASLPDPSPYADALWRLAVVHFDATADLDKAADAIARSFELAERGAPFNEPEAVVWRSELHFHRGDLERSDADAERMLGLSRNLSVHTRTHAIAVKARVHWARGEWDGVREYGEELRAHLRNNPEASWCLYSANLAAYDAIADLVRGRPLPADLKELVDRIVPDSPATNAAAMMVPLVMAGEPVLEEEARRAYAPETPIWDRESMWDLTQTHFALVDVMRERWDAVERDLVRLDQMARHGARFAAALAAAMREELAAARGGPAPSHDGLRGLGYTGVSELMRYRVPRVPLAPWQGVSSPVAS